MGLVSQTTSPAQAPFFKDSKDRSGLLTHQLFKSNGFFDHFGLSKDKIGHIALDDHGFHFGQTLVVAVVPTHHVIGTLVAGGQLFDVGFDLLRLGVQGVATDNFCHHQTQANTLLGLRAENIDEASIKILKKFL